MSDGKVPRPKYRTALLTSCLVVLCVTALSIGLFFGLRDNKTVFENHVYFKELHGDVIAADVTVTQNEESFNFENAAVIYDFSTGLTVYRSTKADEHSQRCLVESFLMNETKTPNDVKSLMQKDQVLGKTDFEEFRVTNVWLNEEALGPKSRDLCVDQEIHFIEKIEGDGDGVMNNADVGDDDDDERTIKLTLQDGILGIVSKKLPLRSAEWLKTSDAHHSMCFSERKTARINVQYNPMQQYAPRNIPLPKRSQFNNHKYGNRTPSVMETLPRKRRYNFNNNESARKH